MGNYIGVAITYRALRLARHSPAPYVHTPLLVSCFTLGKLAERLRSVTSNKLLRLDDSKSCASNYLAVR